MANDRLNNNRLRRRNQLDVGKTTSVVLNLVLFIKNFFVKRKKLAIGLILLLTLSIFAFNQFNGKTKGVEELSDKEVVVVDSSFEFPALDSQGQPTKDKIKFTISTAEKTGQVLVQDKVYTARNQKKFLIINLALKNDFARLVNIFPGNLVRLTYTGEEENRFAPDLHNNLVQVSAISTKLERIGFVVPEEEVFFNLYVGELEGEKEIVEVKFKS